MCFTKKQDLNLRDFNMTAEINKSKTSTNHISRKCKCRLDGRKYNWIINGAIRINVDASVKKSCIWKRLSLESCYICLWKWEKFSNYHGWFCDKIRVMQQKNDNYPDTF